MKFDLDLKKTVVVIPTYNEIENITSMVNSIFNIYPEINILVIDDNSPDETYLEVENLKLKYSNLFLIKRNYKDGLGSAYIKAFDYCLKHDFDYIVQMDCDFSHDPKEIQSLLNELKDHDLAIGSRYINGLRVINWPIKRLLISLVAGLYIKLVTGLPFKDCTGGFKAFRSSAIKKIGLNKIISKGYIFQAEMNFRAFRHGLKIKEVPITFYERKFGVSKLQKDVVLEGLITIIKARFSNL